MTQKHRQRISIRGGFISLIEYIFPPRCVFCNSLLMVGTPIYICGKCSEKFKYYNNSINYLNLPGDIETYCDGMVCVGQYTAYLKNSLKRFKFSNKPSYYRAFGKILALKIKNTIDFNQIDMIIPVPLHKSRQRQRGYNQAELIGKYVSMLLGIPLEVNNLIKISESKSQSVLSRNERLTNVEGLFRVSSIDKMRNKRILIIDDIITTGSTVNECSKALKQAGAVSVIAVAIATTRGC